MQDPLHLAQEEERILELEYQKMEAEYRVEWGLTAA